LQWEQNKGGKKKERKRTGRKDGRGKTKKEGRKETKDIQKEEGKSERGRK
jgi:hypothetical protein